MCWISGKLPSSAWLLAAVLGALLSSEGLVKGNTASGAIVFPYKTGTTIEHWGYDTKQNNRLGSLTEEFANILFREESYNVLRAPIRAIYNESWEYDTCPWVGHPANGIVNDSAYTCSINDFTHTQNADSTAQFYSNLKQGYYQGKFYPPHPPYCYYTEADIPEFWDGVDKAESLKAKEYAVLIGDFLKYFEDRGFLHTWFGLENETGYLSARKFMELMEELLKLAEGGYFSWPEKGVIVPELYGPFASWNRDVFKLGGFDKGWQITAGTHYYGHEREVHNDDGRFKFQEQLLTWVASLPDDIPKWHTEVHYAPIVDMVEEFGESATEMDCLENMVLQFADYWDYGFSGFIWWAYRKENQAVESSTKYKSMNMFTELSPPGSTPILVDDHDGKQATRRSVVTRATRNGDKMTIWASNNLPEAQENYQFVLAAAVLKTCGASEYLPITTEQFYLTQETTQITAKRRNITVDTPLVAWRSGVGQPTATNAFTVTLPPYTVTAITFDFEETSEIPPASSFRFDCTEDVSVFEKDLVTDSTSTELSMNGKKNWEAYSLLKFATPGVTGVVLKATLHLHVGSTGIDEMLVDHIGNDWSASTVNFASTPNRPHLALSSGQLLERETWASFDVTWAFGDIEDEHSFLLFTTQKNTSYWTFHSMESDFKPYLEVEALTADPTPSGNICDAVPAPAVPATPAPPAIYCFDAKLVKCKSPDRSGKWETHDLILAAAREGGYAGYAYFSGNKKGQLFYEGQCDERKDQTNEWFIFTAASCSYETQEQVQTADDSVPLFTVEVPSSKMSGSAPDGEAVSDMSPARANVTLGDQIIYSYGDSRTNCIHLQTDPDAAQRLSSFTAEAIAVGPSQEDTINWEVSMSRYGAQGPLAYRYVDRLQLCGFAYGIYDVILKNITTMEGETQPRGQAIGTVTVLSAPPLPPDMPDTSARNSSSRYSPPPLESTDSGACQVSGVTAAVVLMLCGSYFTAAWF